MRLLDFPTPVRSKLIHIVAGFALLAGCSADAYRRSADAEVNRILRQRKEKTLEYQPDTTIASEPAQPVPDEAYEKVPETVVAPPATAPIEPVVEAGVPYGPLGPEAFFKGLPAPTELAVGLEETLAQLGAASTPLMYGPPAPRRPVNRFDLFKSLQYATLHSREYADQLEELYLAALDVTLERHLLSPRPFATAGLEYTGGQRDVEYRSALVATGAVGVRQQLPYGGEIVAQTLVEFVDALSDNAENGESAALVLSGSVPLLRGAGLVNLEALIASERELIYSVRSFEDFRRSFAVAIASQYFNLLARQQSLANRRLFLRNTQSLLEQARALFSAGRVTFLEVQRSEQSLLGGQNELLNAQQDYEDALDNFKVNLGMPIEEEFEVVPVQLDVTVPDIGALDVQELAHTYRLDLQTARDRIDDARRAVANANNGLLPELNLAGTARTGSRAGDPAVDLDSRTLTYSAGVTLDLPIDRVAERNAYRRALVGFQQSQRAFDVLRDQVTADVRSAVRGIRSAQASLEIQRRSIESAERQIELAYLLLKTAESETRDIVEAQEDLLEAQDDYEQAQVNLQIQVLQFLRDSGTLRVDPAAGAIGQALERTAASAEDALRGTDVENEIAPRQ